jgi:hypothetical protein
MDTITTHVFYFDNRIFFTQREHDPHNIRLSPLNSAGKNHALALRSNDTLVAWESRYGQLNLLLTVKAKVISGETGLP